MKQIGDKVRWNGVNGSLSGVVTQVIGGGNFLVRIDNGKFVIVNENSFLDE